MMGDKRWFSDLKNSKVLFCIWSVFLASMLSYWIKNAATMSFLDFGYNITNISMCIVAMQRVATSWTKSYKMMTKEFFTKVHLFHHKDNNSNTLKVYHKAEKFSTFMTTVMQIEIYIGSILFICTPLYKSYRRGMFQSVKPVNATYDHSIVLDLPFNHTTNFHGYLLVFLANGFMVLDVASCYGAFDVYICVILFHLTGHLLILKHNLEIIPMPENNSQNQTKTDIISNIFYNDKESNKITGYLIESIEHYKMINKFMNEVSITFGSTLCCYFIFHQITLCIFLLELSQMTLEAFGSFAILTFALLQQLILISVMFEMLGSQYETVKDSVYGVPWECMDTKNRKLVLNHLCNVQRTVPFKALGVLPIGVKTMASILKNTISYFMLLRASTSAEN